MNKIEDDFRPLYDDLLFKESLAKEENRKFLEYFLEIFLDLKLGSLRGKLHVEYESPIEKWAYSEKAMRTDLTVYLSNIEINIECFSTLDKEAYEKTMCYAMKKASNAKCKEKYREIRPLIQLVFIHRFDMKFNQDVMNKYLITNTMNMDDTLSADKFQIYYYRLDNAKTYKYNEDRKLRLLHFIEANTKEERAKIAKGDDLLMEFDKSLNEYVMDEKTKKFFAEWDREIYQHRAEKRGIKIGEKRGKKQGIIETAKNMLIENVPLTTIVKCTGLSREEILKLQ
ncbi:MAG: Rpn family recombination-promoting nuclease/putative transposase [Bacilli bacterium]|nr:Rpn family recombination-promoting nuclease/putative transposase [Bacilli bacterium]